MKTDENKVTETKTVSQTKPRRQWPKNLLLIPACFVAGLGGAWTYVGSGLFPTMQSTKSIEMQRVIAEGEVVTDIAKQVSPSVVSITFEAAVSGGYFGTSYEQGAGTGIILSKDGYILTNKHVLPSGASNVKVIANDGTTYDKVTIVGRDPINDLAFLKINIRYRFGYQPFDYGR